MSSLKKDISSPDVDDSDSDDDLDNVEEMGPKSLAAFEGRPLLGRDIDSLEEVREVGPTSLIALADKLDLGPTVQQTDTNEDSLDLVVNMGPASMKALAASQPNENSKKVNGKLKEGMPVPQPKPRRKAQAQEDKNLTDVHAENARLRGQKVELEQQLDRTKRDSDARAKQQEKMIGKLTAQLESKEKELAKLAKKDAELKSLKDKMKSEIERKVAEKDAKCKSATASLQKEISDLKKQLEETRRLREAEKKQLKKEADKIRGQLHKQVKTDDTKIRQAEIDGLMAEVDDLKQQLQIKGAQVNDLNRLASTRGEEKDRLTREVETLKRELEQSKVDEKKTVVEKERLAKEAENLQGELLTLRQSRTDDGKTKQAEISRLTAENGDLQRQLQDKNAQIRNLNQSASHQVVERERLAKEAENLQGELMTLRQSRTDDGKTKQAEISRLTGEIRDLRGQLQAKGTLIEQLNQQANAHEDEKRQLERDVEELQGNVRRLQQERNDDGRAKHVELERLNMEIGTLKGQLQIKNAQVEDLSQLASTRGEEKELLENQVKHLREQVLKIQDVKKSVIDDNQTKIARIDELTKRLTLQSRQLEQQSREIEANRVRAGGERHDLVASTPAMNSGSRSVIDDRICPMCQKRFPEPISQQEYERHVQSHF